MRVQHSIYSGNLNEIKNVWLVELGKKDNVYIYYSDGKQNHELVVKKGKDFNHFRIYEK